MGSFHERCCFLEGFLFFLKSSSEYPLDFLTDGNGELDLYLDEVISMFPDLFLWVTNTNHMSQKEVIMFSLKWNYSYSWPHIVTFYPKKCIGKG